MQRNKLQCSMRQRLCQGPPHWTRVRGITSSRRNRLHLCAWVSWPVTAWSAESMLAASGVDQHGCDRSNARRAYALAITACLQIHYSLSPGSQSWPTPPIALPLLALPARAFKVWKTVMLYNDHSPTSDLRHSFEFVRKAFLHCSEPMLNGPISIPAMPHIAPRVWT